MFALPANVGSAAANHALPRVPRVASQLVQAEAGALMERTKRNIPSRELTCPLYQGTSEDDFPFPRVGYVTWRVG